MDSIFGEFQYFIRRINNFHSGGGLNPGETIEDLEQRFRVQIERGLVIHDPDSQETAMEILLSDLPESKQRQHLMELRKKGTTTFKAKAKRPRVLVGGQSQTIEQKREKALSLMVRALEAVGLKVKRQPLGIKMLYAEHSLKNVDYNDPNDLKLLFVNTVRISGHAKKANPAQLAVEFNKIASR